MSGFYDKAKLSEIERNEEEERKLKEKVKR